MLMIRPAVAADLPAILPVLDAARCIMRSDGNLLQWAGGYPSEEVIEVDLASGWGRVGVESGRVGAYFAFIPGPDPTYGRIDGGAWLDEDPYYVIHRIASFPQVHGVFRAMLDYASAVTDNIRIDTHRDNRIMQYNLQKYGFSYCGIIYLRSGDERLAFQRHLRQKDAAPFSSR